MKSLRKLHTGKPYVQFERRTEASVRVTSCASSDPSQQWEERPQWANTDRSALWMKCFPSNSGTKSFPDGSGLSDS